MFKKKEKKHRGNIILQKEIDDILNIVESQKKQNKELCEKLKLLNDICKEGIGQ